VNLKLSYNLPTINSNLQISGSKSETNRLLVLQALYPNLVLENTSNSDDSEVMLNALAITHHPSPIAQTIDVQHAGTAMRFLTAYFAIQEGKEVVLTTTNGTKSLDVAKDAEIVVVGSFLNLDILSKWLAEQNKNVLCLCSGWQDKFNLEDTICAGAISDYLISTGQFTSVEDSSIAAKYLYLSAKDNYLGYLKSSSHRRRLKNLNLNEDIKYCLTPNQTDVIPILKNGKLVKL